MRFRQVHLDFHTSPAIPGIGEKFDKHQWQDTLQSAAVDSITLFALCHHGYSYYDTKVGFRHPGLSFDLLRAQVEACAEINVATPIYLSAGLHYHYSQLHPQWCEMNSEGKLLNPFQPGFRKMCFNTPYLDKLCEQIGEVIDLFPETNGIFLDIIYQGECCCENCRTQMLRMGMNPMLSEDRKKHAQIVLEQYYKKTTSAVRDKNPKLNIFHNSGHVSVGSERILPYFSHLELESLPTGGWGYDHYPMSAAYVRNFGMEFLGMTGKFHTTWGEFGGFKHPNALRYECAAMLANGSKCSIGDQLPPSGKIDKSTYEIIGAAYREVAAKEPWCDRVRSLARIALVSGIDPEALAAPRETPGDVGASRLLLEAHLPFDVIDTNMDFSRYEVLVLPDDVPLSEAGAKRLQEYLAKGGKVVLSGDSGKDASGTQFLLDLPFDFEGMSPYNPDYIESAPQFAPEYLSTPFVMYTASNRIHVKDGAISLGRIYDPWFNRTWEHFYSHQHTPFRPEPSGYDAGAMSENVLYFSHKVFSIYRFFGAVPFKEFLTKVLHAFLGKTLPVEVGLPSQGRVTLMDQPDQNRAILHLLYANTILRGGPQECENAHVWGNPTFREVIDELLPTGPVPVSLRLDRKVSSVRVVPEGRALPFEEKDGRMVFTAPGFCCHSMIELNYR
ncbi:MAG: beta-galactosidase trimerization domain-containing protein [Victivallaceae bacterium]|nr:beta-galactosidase trimerization domain-containing protein [Victivallaceae bacterium]